MITTLTGLVSNLNKLKSSAVYTLSFSLDLEDYGVTILKNGCSAHRNFESCTEAIVFCTNTLTLASNRALTDDLL